MANPLKKTMAYLGLVEDELEYDEEPVATAHPAPVAPVQHPAPAKAPVTPLRKPKAPKRPVRSASRRSSHSEAHEMTTSPARASRNGGGVDFFGNFQRDFSALTDLLSGGSSSGRSGSRDSIPSHSSHNH